MRTCIACRALAPEGASGCPQCGAALHAARFRLAPTTPVEAVAPQPPAAAPAHRPTNAPGPALPAAAAIAAAASIPRRTLMLGAVVVVALLLVGGSFYAMSAEARYPERYLVAEGDMPAGLANAQLPSFVRGELGVEETPGEISKRKLADFESRSGIRPDEGWLQVIGESRASVDVLVFAFRFDSKSDAQKWLDDGRSQCASGAERARVLHDRSVVVLLVAEGENDGPALKRVAEVVLGNAPRLKDACV